MARSAAHIVLEAVNCAIYADIHGLRQLIAHGTLQLDIFLRVLLTYLPETTDPSLYTGLLHDLITGNLSAIDEGELPSESTKDLSDVEARRQVRRLRLFPLRLETDQSNADLFTSFLLERAHRIDAETGALPLLQKLLEPFLDHATSLQTWMISKLLPLLRLDYEYYPQRASNYSLAEFERLRGSFAIKALLAESTKQHTDGSLDTQVGRDLRGLVGPWMYRSTQGDCGEIVEDDSNTNWAIVNQWLVELSLGDFSQVINVFEQWDGPQDVDYGSWASSHDEMDRKFIQASTLRYAQAGLAAIIASRDMSLKSGNGVQQILVRVSRLVALPFSRDLQTADSAFPTDGIPNEYAASISQAHIYHDNLLHESNPVTRPSKESLELISLLLIVSYTLETMGSAQTLNLVLTLTLWSTVTDQRNIFRKVLYPLQAKKNKDDKSWRKVRQQLLYLRDWSYNEGTNESLNNNARRGIFCLIDRIEMETEILRTLLMEGCYNLVTEIYCAEDFTVLPQDRVEKAIIDVVLMNYDNASNGNKNRGGMKKASDMRVMNWLDLFSKYFPLSKTLEEIAALLRATHALSFYSLTLQHGVPFQPVNIRVHSDPLSLIDKILTQNPRSYTKLDDLLDIGKNLIKAGLIEQRQADTRGLKMSEEERLSIVERQVIAKAIEASLTEQDFDTAYSYITTRLSSSEVNQNSLQTQVTAENDIIWQAAYQAGRSQVKSPSGSSEVRRLEQRMELLSQALLLAPSLSLHEVLITWRKCEEEMNQLVRQATEEEESWSRGDQRLPGGFAGDELEREKQRPRESTRNAMNEEAPMGLFDVAKGAAAALSKTAFPLRSPGSANKAGSFKIASPSSVKGIESDDGDQHSINSAGEAGRVRKRDMVSNMVTGGLASGIGWVLGAPPARHE